MKEYAIWSRVFFFYKLHVGQQVVETTDNHPFWVEGKGRVTAIDLKVGDQLKQSNGNILAIEQIEIVHHEQKVKVITLQLRIIIRIL